MGCLFSHISILFIKRMSLSQNIARGHTTDVYCVKGPKIFKSLALKSDCVSECAGRFEKNPMSVLHSKLVFFLKISFHRDFNAQPGSGTIDLNQKFQMMA